MAQKSLPADREFLVFGFDDLTQDTLYRVKASFDPSFPLGQTLEALVKTEVDLNPPSFDLPDSIESRFLFRSFAYDSLTGRWGVLGSDAREGDVRIWEMNSQGELVHTIELTDFRGLTRTMGPISANGTGYWYLNPSPVRKVKVGSSETAAANRNQADRSFWISADEASYAWAIPGVGAQSGFQGSGSGIRFGQFRSDRRGPTGLARFGDSWYVIDDDGIRTWGLDEIPSGTAPSRYFLTLPGNIVEPHDLVILGDVTPNRYYTLDATRRRIVSLKPTGQEVTTSPSQLEIATIRVNGRLVPNVFGNTGPFNYTYRAFQSDLTRTPHIAITAVATTALASVDIAPSNRFIFPEAMPRQDSLGRFILPNPQTTKYHPFRITLSDPGQGTREYTLNVRLEVLRDVAIPEPTQTKTCWDGSVIPIDQDCPPEPPSSDPPVINVWQVTPDTVEIGEEAIVTWSVTGATKVVRRDPGNVRTEVESSGTQSFRFSTAAVRTWDLEASNQHGTTRGDRISLTVEAAPPPDDPPRLDGFDATPSTQIDQGESVNLNFRSTNCQYVTINGNRQSSVDGTLKVTPSVTTSYELIGFHADGRKTDPLSLTITVTVVTVDTDDDDDDTGTEPEPDTPDPVSIRSFIASTLTPEANAPVTVSGRLINAIRATLKIGTAAAVNLSLSSAGTFSHTFTPTGIARVVLTAIGEGAGNTATRSLTITPQEAPPIPPGVIESFDISDRNPSSGDAVTISGRFRNATGVLTINGVDSAVASPFSRTIRPTATTTVRLTITDAAGRTAFRGGTIFVGVSEIPPATVTVSMIPNTGLQGSKYTVYWDSANASRVTRNGVEVALSGRETFTAGSTARTFTFRAFGPGGDSLPVRRTFTPETIPPPFGTLVASSTSILEGESVVLRYTSLNARSRSLTGFGSLEAANGSFTITPPAGRNIIVLTLVGNDGSIVTYSVTIVVTAVLTGVVDVRDGFEWVVQLPFVGNQYPISSNRTGSPLRDGERVVFEIDPRNNYIEIGAAAATRQLTGAQAAALGIAGWGATTATLYATYASASLALSGLAMSGYLAAIAAPFATAIGALFLPVGILLVLAGIAGNQDRQYPFTTTSAFILIGRDVLSSLGESTSLPSGAPITNPTVIRADGRPLGTPILMDNVAVRYSAFGRTMDATILNAGSDPAQARITFSSIDGPWFKARVNEMGNYLDRVIPPAATKAAHSATITQRR